MAWKYNFEAVLLFFFYKSIIPDNISGQLTTVFDK